MTIHHCCERMRDAVEFRCDQHPVVGECGDYLIGYSEKFDEYGLWVHDGPGGSASSWIEIHHCPFCGGRMSPSRREEWFDRLEELGVEPEDAPPEMESSKWWLGEGETARRSAWMPEKKTWDWVCLTVLPRIGMWTGQIRFALAVAWIEGFNWGQDESISALMQERCEERLGRRTPLGWHDYVKADSLGVSANDMPSDADMTDGEHLRAIAALRAELMNALGVVEPDTEEDADESLRRTGPAEVAVRDDVDHVAAQWLASRAMAEISADGFAQVDVVELFDVPPAQPVPVGLQFIRAALRDARPSNPGLIAMLVVPLPATRDLVVSAPDFAAVASGSWKYGPGLEVVGLYLLEPCSGSRRAC